MQDGASKKDSGSRLSRCATKLHLQLLAMDRGILTFLLLKFLSLTSSTSQLQYHHKLFLSLNLKSHNKLRTLLTKSDSC